MLAVLLSLCLALFLADGVVSLLDDSLILFLGVRPLTALRGLVFFLAVLAALAVYVLIAFVPMIPKRFFLPITLFNPVAGLAFIPLLIYCYDRLQLVTWVISVIQAGLGFWMLHRLRGGIKVGWPLFPVHRLGIRGFSWGNLSVFAAVNIFLIPPVVVLYLVFCLALGVDHLSDGFLKLRPDGLTVQVRKYVRADGKSVQLFPMSHIGDAVFYRALGESFPTNSVILMEGVTDEQNLLTNKISYKRAAKSLGLSEQQKEFEPRGEIVSADVDVEAFHTNTIGFMNMVMRIHAKGLRPEYLMELLQYTPPPHFEHQVIEDLLIKRNQHLLAEIDSHLPSSDHLIVPWGAAHMPGIAQGVLSSGFRLDQTENHVVIRFRSTGSDGKIAEKPADESKATRE
ncbi:MAG: hypothetical protein EPO07_15670 [Verrucomicrobia bacterium]|nr:MAG: hypothetical protein EPO07_15670 [Verrucomicrobiota bacterium]